MLFTFPVIGAILLRGVAAAVPHLTPALDARDCPHDNCLRAVIASAFMTRSATADCSSYFLTTVTPVATTTTVTIATVTSLVDMKRRNDGDMIIARQQTVTPSQIPAYASACSGSVKYSSACSCIGVTAMTTTAPTPTYTQTVTATTVVVSPPTLDTTQYNLFECSDTSGLKTPTPLTLNTCVITDRSLSDNFGEFIGGACTPDECFVNFYGDAQCSSAPITAGVSVTDTTCFDFEFVYAAMLLCPTCPHS